MSIEFVSPYSGAPLAREGDAYADAAGNRFPVVNGVPRFCDPSNYTASFGEQWNMFSTIQLDRSENDVTQSATRFFRETGWSPEALADSNVLEVGSGAGRFSRVVLEQTPAKLWSVDYSSAVEANMKNNGEIAPDRFRLAQASVYEMPFPDNSFDRVFCLGVLQHTPDFGASVRALIAKAKPGGEIVVDFYPIRGFWSKINAKYMLRPITKKLSRATLLRLIDRNVDWMTKASDTLHRVGLSHLRRFLPLVDINQVVPAGLTPAERREWVVLDTFDMLSPEYDNPQRVKTVAKMFRDSGARVTFAGFVDVGTSRAAVVRGIKE